MKKPTLSIIAVAWGFLCWGLPSRLAGEIHGGPLRVNPANPRYFTNDTAKAIYLTGSHTWNNLKDAGPSDPPPHFDYDGYLDVVQSHGHNFFRLWTWEIPKSKCGTDSAQFTEPFPWLRAGPGLANDGKLKFDLTQFDQSYFDRVRTRVIAAGVRDIYVSIMLFDGFGEQFCLTPGNGHPYDGVNNINGINPASTVFTLDNPAALEIQTAYVRKLVDTVNDLDNVLYEIINEANINSTGWQYQMINTLNAYQDSLPKQHPVGMTFQAGGGLNSTLFNSPADWISPGLVKIYGVNPPPGDGSKVVLADTDHLYGVGGDFNWVWRTFTRALNPIYMDPMDTDAVREGARRAMGHTRDYAGRLDLVHTSPCGDLTSTTYALANPGVEYLVYQPAASSFTVNLAASTATYTVEWFNPALGTAALAANVTGGANRTFTAPFAGPSVLYLRSASQPVEPTLTARLTSPQSGTGFAVPPPTITLTAMASERYGSISKVEFHDGVTLLGTAVSLPYRVAWDNATTGTHTLTAVATNQLGHSMKSAPVTIIVGGDPRLTDVRLTNGVMGCVLLGDLGGRYRVDFSINLLDWSALQTVTIAPQPGYPGGAAFIADPQSVSYPARFYRAVLIP